MRCELVDSEAAAVLCGRPVEVVRAAVRAGELVNHGRGRAYRLDPWEVARVLGDVWGLGS